jgi:hypothetical protein
MIYIESKRKKIENIRAKYPNAIICDVTSKSDNGLVKLSPFYPHGNIPIPFSDDCFGMSVEGIWQGLKVFENEDIDIACFSNASMKNIKRTCSVHGSIIGHRKGVHGSEILNYHDAKHLIYIPTYKWVLQNVVTGIIKRMKIASQSNDIVLLDYNTSENVDSLKPLSHAFLIKAFIMGLYPYNE